jgi:hypothetical protein
LQLFFFGDKAVQLQLYMLPVCIRVQSYLQLELVLGVYQKA